MTVGELIKELAGCPGDALVVMSKDGEGNDFSPLSEVATGDYVAESTWGGHLRDSEYDEEEDGPDGAVKAIVLWPTN
jgi:hypothetical protein